MENYKSPICDYHTKEQMMAEKKFIEINVKNKEHRACCGTIIKLTEDTKIMHDELVKFKEQIEKTDIPQNMKQSLDQKIAKINERHKELVEKSQICGCF